MLIIAFFHLQYFFYEHHNMRNNISLKCIDLLTTDNFVANKTKIIECKSKKKLKIYTVSIKCYNCKFAMPIDAYSVHYIVVLW